MLENVFTSSTRHQCDHWPLSSLSLQMYKQLICHLSQCCSSHGAEVNCSIWVSALWIQLINLSLHTVAFFSPTLFSSFSPAASWPIQKVSHIPSCLLSLSLSLSQSLSLSLTPMLLIEDKAAQVVIVSIRLHSICTASSGNLCLCLCVCTLEWTTHVHTCTLTVFSGEHDSFMHT